MNLLIHMKWYLNEMHYLNALIFSSKILVVVAATACRWQHLLCSLLLSAIYSVKKKPEMACKLFPKVAEVMCAALY